MSTTPVEDLAAARLTRLWEEVEEEARWLRSQREQLERTLSELQALLPPIPTPRPDLRVVTGDDDA